MGKEVFEKIKDFLRRNNVPYIEFHHKKVLTSRTNRVSLQSWDTD